VGADARWHTEAVAGRHDQRHVGRRVRWFALNTTQVGAAAEAFAARWLEAQGARILLKNFRRRRGELDLVAEHCGVLIIVEIRLRGSDRHGGAAASVGPAKQRRIIHTATQLLQLRPDLARMPVRFDVLAMQPRGLDPGSEEYSIEWIRHAFSADR